MSERKVSVTIAIPISLFLWIQDYREKYKLSFSQAIRELLQKGKVHELQFSPQGTLVETLGREETESPGEAGNGEKPS